MYVQIYPPLQIINDNGKTYETINALLSDRSPLFREKFAFELAAKLTLLKDSQS